MELVLLNFENEVLTILCQVCSAEGQLPVKQPLRHASFNSMTWHCQLV